MRRKKVTKAAPTREDFGTRGAPLNTSHPFYFGFLAASGAVIALTLLRAFASVSQVFVLIIISLFFAAGLNPSVLFFQKRGMKRGLAVASVVTSVLIFIGLFIFYISSFRSRKIKNEIPQDIFDHETFSTIDLKVTTKPKKKAIKKVSKKTTKKAVKKPTKKSSSLKGR